MAGVKAPYRNKMKTPAKVIGRIALDLIRAYGRKQTLFNSNKYSGGSITHPDPDSVLHDILSLTHEDSTVAIAVRGDLITAQGVAPLWTRLPKGTINQVLTMVDANDPDWANSQGLSSVGPTSVGVGDQEVISCGAVTDDILDFIVIVNAQNVSGGAGFRVFHNMARVAGRITYNWTIDAGNLNVNIYNDSEVDTNVMVWYGTSLATGGAVAVHSYGELERDADPLHLADSVAVVAGAIIAGSVTSTHVIDGVYLQVDESAKFDIQFTFIGLTLLPVHCHFRGRYEGNPAHDVWLYQWNYTTVAWVRTTAAAQDFPNSATDYTLHFDLISTADYVSGGESKLRIYHNSVPNPGHDMYIDYIDLTEQTLALAVAGTFYPLEDLAAGPDNNVTVNGAAGTMTIVDSGDYLVMNAISFAATHEATITCALFRNGVEFDGVWKHGMGSAHAYVTGSAIAILALVAGDVLSWRFSSDLPLSYLSAAAARMAITKQN